MFRVKSFAKVAATLILHQCETYIRRYGKLHRLDITIIRLVWQDFFVVRPYLLKVTIYLFFAQITHVKQQTMIHMLKN